MPENVPLEGAEAFCPFHAATTHIGHAKGPENISPRSTNTARSNNWTDLTGREGIVAITEYSLR